MNNYQLITCAVSPLMTNCYVLIDGISKKAVVIDPGGWSEQLEQAISSAGEVVAIINTHGHWDHIGANQQIHDLTGAPVMIHKLDALCLSSPDANLMLHFPGASGDGGHYDRLLVEGDDIEVGSLTLHVMHTPGHSAGSICLLCGDLLFTGDTLFREACGRTDLPGGNMQKMLDSLVRIVQIKGDFLVLPGHGLASRLDYERQFNPYLMIKPR